MGKDSSRRLLASLVYSGVVREECLKDEYIKKCYDALTFKYSLIDALIIWRSARNLTQGQFAKSIGRTQQDVSRFEGGHNVTINFVSTIFGAINNTDPLDFKHMLIAAVVSWRIEYQTSQVQLAKRINQKQQDISRFENGDNVTINLVSKIFSIVDVPCIGVANKEVL